MATNYIGPGEQLNLEVVSGIETTDPARSGELFGVAQGDRNSSSEEAVLKLNGIHDLAVEAVDDGGDTVVEMGDKLYHSPQDTIEINKKRSGMFIGYALQRISTVGGNDTIEVLLVQGGDDGRHTVENFEVNPVTSKIAGGAAGGTAGDENAMLFERNAFEYHIIGTATVTAPSLAAGGLNIALDDAENDGIEITQGITARSKAAFVVGTDPAFFFKCRITIPNVSGADDCLVGFRKAEAYQAAPDDYDEMAALNVISGDIYIETILNDAATDSTDTTDNFADGETHELEVRVNSAGVVTFKIDGAAPSTTATFTFDDAEVVLPFVYLRHDADPEAGAVLLSHWEVGFLPQSA